MASTSLPMIFFLLFICSSSCSSSFAQLPEEPLVGRGGRISAGRRECRLEKLNAMEADRRVEAEAGSIEYWDVESHEELQCAGVAVHRLTMEPQSLLLPEFSNSPRIVYFLTGSGYTGPLAPGCPETYQSFQGMSGGGSQQEESEEEGESSSRRRRDQHQKIVRFRQGDVIAYPAGISHWCYNDGDKPAQAIVVYDIGSQWNQLDRRHRSFKLAGSGGRQQQQQQSGHQEEKEEEMRTSNNIFSGFDVELLSEMLGVNKEVATKIQSKDDRRGPIVRVEAGLHFLHPSMREEEEEQQQQRESKEEKEEEERRRRPSKETTPGNGMEEVAALCRASIRKNIDNPARADVFNPRGGRITSLNGNNLPILDFIAMSAERGVLYRNAYHVPHWNINAHSVIFATGGRGRIQIVDNKGRNVFDGELRRGQLVIVPQGFAVVKKAGEEGFEWVAFKTSGRAMSSPIVGKGSVMRGMPEDVIANAFKISREDARSIKYNRAEEVAILAPIRRSSSQ